jgi:serine/threonine protein kinase/sugar lactone lactonase YvrE
MSDGQENPPAVVPPVSTFTGPVAELIAQQMLLPPTRPGLLAVLDHFEILRVLGGGGMGIVLLARDSKTGREVAIKLVKSDLVTNLQVVHRFLKEVGHLKRLQHTNIVPVQEISDRPEGPYFVMPYFEKGSLANRIKPGQPLDTETILNIATQVAEGLGFAHRSGIIHRDLKPANILLGANGQVCLGDFGLARTMFNDTIVDVESRHLEGTAPYMSPAVAAGNAEDTRCDIYSFGALLYEMLTGQPPYQGRGTKEILDQILAGPPKPITSLNPAADRGLVAVAETALARELRDRYAEMRDVLTDLQRIKAGKPPARQNKVRRNWHVTIIIEMVACVAVIALLAWMFFRDRSGPVKPPQPPAAPAAVSPPTVSKPVVNPPAVSQPLPKITTLAGQVGVGGYADGTGTQAQFRLPNNVAVDHAGNVYVADTANNIIRKITSDGVVSTLAGLAGEHGSIDGAGSSARFWAPFGIAVDVFGNVYVADTANNTIRKITPAGMVTTLAGSAGHPGSADGLGSNARFRNPWSVAVDSRGNVIVADMSNDTVRKITPDGQTTTLAGQAGVSGNADGFANNAQFNDPFAVTVDSADNIYVSDSGNNTIRKMTPGGTVVTLAGLAGYAGGNDGNADTARFWNPQGLAVDNAGNVYVADTGNNTVRKITPTGVVNTLPELTATGSTSAPAVGSAPLNSPNGVALDSAGNLYIADTNDHCIRKLALSR